MNDLRRWLDIVLCESDFDVIAYHGSDQDFDSFDAATMRANRWGPYGFCFTQDPQVAASYGDIVYKVELRIRNPRIVQNAEDFQSFKNSERQLRMSGVDAVAGPNDLGQFEIVIFDPADIQILKKITKAGAMTLAEAMSGYIEKFWINTVDRYLEPMDQGSEHEIDLPGDGTLGFNDSIAAGWVRGGIHDGKLYLTARDRLTARDALRIALKNYAPDEVHIELDGGEYLALTPKQAANWGRRS